MNKSKLIFSVTLIFTFALISFAQSVPNLKGTWTEYRPNGTKVTSYKVKIFQINGVTTISIAGSRVTAVIRGNKITWRNSTASGTILNGGNRINWADKSFWTKDTPKPKPKPKTTSTRTQPRPTSTPKRTTMPRRATTPTRTIKPQRTISLEQQCFNMVQGRVAWTKNGSKRWADANVRKLCAGTKNPNALIACFNSQINQNKNWQTAMNYCKGNRSNKTNTGTVSNRKIVDLTGTWLVYFKNGKVGTIPMEITQDGQIFTFDTGIGNRKDKGTVLNNSIYHKGKKIGDIAEDGRLIRLNEGVIWVKQ